MARAPGDLYIKYAPGDDGTDVIPADAPFWASPSIAMIDAAGMSVPGAVPLTFATVGVPIFIQVTVDSISDQPRTGVKVQTWVCDYTGGGVGPDTAQASGGAAGRIGSVPTAVRKGVPGIASVPWTPTTDDLINSPNAGEGHVCAAANVFAELPPPPDGALLSAGLLDTVNNRHYGQKNLTVKSAPGIVPHLIAFRLTNPGREPDEFVVTAKELERDLAMGPLEQEHLLVTHFVTLVDGKPEPELVPAGCWREPHERTWLAGGGRLVLKGMPEVTPLRPAKEQARFELVTAEGRDQTVVVAIRPGEHVPVVLRMLNDGAPGEVRAFDMTQQTRDGTVVGGARLIVVHVPEWHCC